MVYLTFASIPMMEVNYMINSESFGYFVYVIAEMSHTRMLNFKREEGFLVFSKAFTDYEARVYQIYRDECELRGILVGDRRVSMTRDLVSVNRNCLLLTETDMPVQSWLFAGGQKNLKNEQLPVNYSVRNLIQTVRDFDLSMHEAMDEEIEDELEEELISDDEGLGEDATQYMMDDLPEDPEQ